MQVVGGAQSGSRASVGQVQQVTKAKATGDKDSPARKQWEFSWLISRV